MHTPGTVSQRARDGLDHFVAKAIRGSLAAPNAACALTPVEAGSAAERRLVMLTVSSYQFRALLFVHFDHDADTRAHFAALAGASVETMDDERFIDAVMERGNLCCGALNRDLSAFYPHIGMSTPCVMDKRSLGHVGALAPSMTHHYRAEVGSGLALHVTLTLCAFGDMDFAYAPRKAEEAVQAEQVDAGELEMF